MESQFYNKGALFGRIKILIGKLENRFDSLKIIAIIICYNLKFVLIAGDISINIDLLK